MLSCTVKGGNICNKNYTHLFFVIILASKPKHCLIILNTDAAYSPLVHLNHHPGDFHKIKYRSYHRYFLFWIQINSNLLVMIFSFSVFSYIQNCEMKNSIKTNGHLRQPHHTTLHLVTVPVAQPTHFFQRTSHISFCQIVYLTRTLLNC